MLGLIGGIKGLNAIVSYNGAVLYSVAEKKNIIETVIPADIVTELIALGRACGATVQIYQGEGLITEEYNERVEYYESLAGYKANVVESLDNVAPKGSIKVLFNGDHEAMKPAFEKAQAKYKGRLDVFFSKPCFLEFVTAGATKGTTLAKYAEMRGVAMSEVVAMGDSFNDYTMIDMAGMGVAVKNGHPDVKSAADYVTENDNDGCAAAEVINKFILGEQK